MLTILGIAALIALLIASLLVLRIKSDPTEKEAVREYLAESKSSPPADQPTTSSNSTHQIPDP